MKILQQIGDIISQKLFTLYTKIQNHIEDYSNPHHLTKQQIGLGNVDNTSDSDKPVSTLQQQQLDTKRDKNDTTGLSDENFTSSYKEKLENLSNYNDADIKNRITTETQRATQAEQALDNKINTKVDKIEGKNLSTNDFTNNEKQKLSHISNIVQNLEIQHQDTSLQIKIDKINTVDGQETTSTARIPEVTAQSDGLMTPEILQTLDNLNTSINSLDYTGTPSPTWQLSKNASGPQLKNSGGIFELRNSEDLEYTSMVLKDITIKGSVTQEGDSFVTNAQTVEVADNTLILNKGEKGNGVTKGNSGIEIDRGTLSPYKIIFDESDDRFKAGEGENLWPIMLRDHDANLTEDAPLIWDATNKRAKTGEKLAEQLAKYLPLDGGTMNGGIWWDSTQASDHPETKLLSCQSGMVLGLRGNIPSSIIIGNITIPSTIIDTTYLYRGNEKIWDSGNDGSGSGLDADLLDGKHADEFATTENLNNYLPLVGGRLTGPVILAKSSVDNSGVLSGHALDGDNWITEPIQEIGQNILSYSDDTLRIGNNCMIQIFGGKNIIIQGDHSAEIDVPETIRLSAAHIELNAGNGVVDGNNNKYWSAGNDGAGSGLDADLLDGKQGSEYALKSETVKLIIINPSYNVANKTFIITANEYTALVNAASGYTDHKSIIIRFLTFYLSITSIYKNENIITFNALLAYSDDTNIHLEPLTFSVDNTYSGMFKDEGINLTPKGNGDKYLADNGNYKTINIPSLSGGASATSGQYVSGVTVSGHTVTVTKAALPTSLPASDVSAWAKAANKPTYTWNEINSKPTFATVATTGSYNDLANKPTIPAAYTLPTASASVLGGIKIGSGLSISNGTVSVSGIAWGNITAKPAFATVATSGSYNDLSNKPTIPSLSGYATQSWVQSQGYLTSHQSLSNYVTLNTAQTISGAKTFTAAVTGTAGFYDTSDARLKQNIKPIQLKSEDIQLHEFDKQGKHSYGVIAQEIEKLYPSTVAENENGYKTVNYNEILIIKCAEQDQKIKQLQNHLQTQTDAIKLLQQKLTELQTQLIQQQK